MITAALESIGLLLGAHPGLLNSPDPEGFTPLICSCAVDIEERTIFLPEKGADANARSQHNLTILDYAEDGSTPLFEAVSSGNPQICISTDEGWCRQSPSGVRRKDTDAAR